MGVGHVAVRSGLGGVVCGAHVGRAAGVLEVSHFQPWWRVEGVRRKVTPQRRHRSPSIRVSLGPASWHGHVDMGNEENSATEVDFGRVVNALPALVWTTQSDGRSDFVNRHWCEYTGLGPSVALDHG